MIKVLIVEDELLVRMGLKSYIENAGVDITVVAALESAEDALLYCKENLVDIVLTDVEMSGLSGIDLVRELKESHDSIGIIVVSCHENFSFLRQAIGYGADKYLLKQEIGQDELISGIQEVYAKLTEQRKHALEKSIRNEPKANTNFKGSPSCTLAPQQYIVGALEYKKNFNSQFQLQQQHFDMMLLQSITEEIFARFNCGESYISKDSGLFCVFYFPLEADELEILTRMGEIYQSIRDNLYQYFNKEFFLSIDHPRTDPGEIYEGYRVARNNLQNGFYCSQAILLLPRKLNSISGRPLNENITFTDFSEEWYQQACSVIDVFFADAKKQNQNPLEVKTEVDRLLVSMQEYLAQSYTLASEGIFQDLQTISYQIIDLFDNYLVLSNWLKQQLKKTVDYFKEKYREQGLYSKIKAYIDLHYTEKITLGSVAKEFHLNETYLSSLFKQKSGENFISYVNKVKISHVKRLLVSTNLTLDEIAEQLNFSNANYLVRVFKRVTGETIGAYKKKRF